MLHGEVGGKLERQNIVGGVSCGGEDSTTGASLVEGANVGSCVLDVLLLGFKEKRKPKMAGTEDHKLGYRHAYNQFQSTRILPTVTVYTSR